MKQDWILRLRQSLPPSSAPTELHQSAERLSSVLIAVGPHSATQRDEILLTKRTHLMENHRGQVSFPGGFWETTDASLMDTALRESQEEIGTAPSDIEILGGLESVRTHQGVHIFPWVGRLGFPYPFVINAAEVERVLFLPVQTLVEEGLKPRKIRVGEINVISPAIEVDGEVVWGATARLLDHLRRYLLST